MLIFARRVLSPPKSFSIRTLCSDSCRPVTLTSDSRLINVRLTPETLETLNPSQFLLYPKALTAQKQSTLLKHALMKLDNTLGVPRSVKQQRKRLGSQPLGLEDEPITHFWPEDCYEFDDVSNGVKVSGIRSEITS